MSDNPRIDELKRRVQQDPASIAFAALADEYRRAGLFHDAIETCRAGLQRHPSYVSARVTLGRALIELGEFQEAAEHLEQVLRSAPENLAAIRALADIHRRNPEPLESLQAAAAEAASAAQTEPVEVAPAPVPVMAVAPFVAPVLAPEPRTETVAAPQPTVAAAAKPAPLPLPLKPIAPPADIPPTAVSVISEDATDTDDLDIVDLAPTLADAHLPVIRELEQLLAGIDRARHSIGA
jgi:tetratricopeptide (TPR) repeat protein